MRERHFPRLCRSCDAPMARQDDTCWSCGAVWDYRSARPHMVRVIPGGQAACADGADQPSAPGVGDLLRAVAQARVDLDRRADEGGGLAAGRSRRVGAQMALVR